MKLFEIVRTYWISDDNFMWCFNERAYANAIFSCNSEKVGFSLNETLDSSIVSGDCVCHRSPCSAVSFPFLNDIIGDWRTSVVFWRKPCQFAGVIGQVVRQEWGSNRTWHIWEQEEKCSSCFSQWTIGLNICYPLFSKRGPKCCYEENKILLLLIELFFLLWYVFSTTFLDKVGLQQLWLAPVSAAAEGTVTVGSGCWEDAQGETGRERSDSIATFLCPIFKGERVFFWVTSESMRSTVGPKSQNDLWEGWNLTWECTSWSS